MKFGYLIHMKIFKFVATRCHILRLNAPNSVSAGALPQTPLVELIAQTFKMDLEDLLLIER